MDKNNVRGISAYIHRNKVIINHKQVTELKTKRACTDKGIDSYNIISNITEGSCQYVNNIKNTCKDKSKHCMKKHHITSILVENDVNNVYDEIDANMVFCGNSLQSSICENQNFEMHQQLNIMHWNVQGWTKEKAYLRETILAHFNPDIISISETFLKRKETIKLDGYEWKGHNRLKIHVNAKRSSGGIGLFIKQGLYHIWNINVIDRSYEGILVVKFDKKNSSYSFIIICCYLPPENSTRGHDGATFYENLLQQIYIHYNVDAIYICGDFNSRISDKHDYIPDIDQIQSRKVIDLHGNVNKHGECMLDFVQDTKFCITNGRVTPEYDDFTCIKQSGKSVVDYFIVPHDIIPNCIEHKVYTMNCLIDELGLQSIIEDVRHIPDHSLLSLKIIVDNSSGENIGSTIYHEPQHKSSQQTFNSNMFTSHPYYFRKYKRNIPENWLQNTDASELHAMIDIAMSRRLSQDKVDNLYETFNAFYHNEMNVHLKYINTLPNHSRKYKSKPKPWWNEMLEDLWKNLVKIERRLKSNVNKNKRRTARKQEEFKNAKNIFDQEYKKQKRKYYREKQLNIENINTKNPREFWRLISNIGPCKKKPNNIPLEVLLENGEVIKDVPTVLNTWKEKYKDLFKEAAPNCFDDAYLHEKICELNELENNMSNTPTSFLNSMILPHEVRKCIFTAKNNKSIGLDNLPYEILKNEISVSLLTKLFNVIFQSRIVPSLWLKAIIKPIPKSAMTDARMPLQYRGISLLSTVSKLYTGILNKRLSEFAECQGLFVEEQNGFRRERSCEEHVFSLSSIIENNLNESKHSFAAFVDMEKAFDKVNRQLLFHKLLTLGIDGNFYHSVKSLYKNNEYSVKLNDYFTDWFNVDMGVRQGDCLSSTLFALFINDLALEIKQMENGIMINGQNICILIFADDIVLLSNSEKQLQDMLNCLDKWCFKSRVNVNGAKTKIVDFRPKRTLQTTFQFKIGDENIHVVNTYKYLGVIFDEFLEFNCAAKTLSGAAGRAIGKLWSVYKGFNGLGYKSFTKLYESYVDPILCYCTGVWGVKKHMYCTSIQNRAIRGFLGVHKFAPNLAINGDMGWLSFSTKQNVCIIRLWNRLINMSNDRLPKMLFDHMYECDKSTWLKYVKTLLHKTGHEQVYQNKVTVESNTIKRILHDQQMATWESDINNKTKLRTYIKFKHEYGVESYIEKFLSKRQRSILAQFRCGILPLKIETGRYINLKIQKRICELCDMNEIEDEFHFLIQCPLYFQLRKELFDAAKNWYPDFDNIADDVKMVILISDDDLCRNAATFLSCAYKKRALMLFNQENVV